MTTERHTPLSHWEAHKYTPQNSRSIKGMILPKFIYSFNEFQVDQNQKGGLVFVKSQIS